MEDNGWPERGLWSYAECGVAFVQVRITDR